MFCWNPKRRRRRTQDLNTQLLYRVLKNQRILDGKLNAISETMKGIEMANAEIQSEVNDLNASLSVISTGIGALSGNLDLALAKIADLEAQGVAPEVIQNLKTAVDGAQSIAAQFAAAVDPEQPTPPVEEVPSEPVTEEPAPETPAEPEAPVDPESPQE